MKTLIALCVLSVMVVLVVSVIHAQGAARNVAADAKVSADGQAAVGATIHHRLEPQDGRVIHGAGQSAKEFKTYYEKVAPTFPVIYMTYCRLDGNHARFFENLKRELASYPDSYLIPQIGLSMTTDGKPEKHFEQDVAAGKYDEKIEAYCEGLRSLGRPVFLRIGFEFNGQWNGYQPETYKAAWIRIVKALRAHGLEEAAAVWCFGPGGNNKDYMSFYPGDEYVDWWAIDLFKPGHFLAQQTKSFMQDAAKRGFPVMIGESTPRTVGVQDGEESWKRWYDLYFRFIHENPQVKAFCYISWNWAETKAWSDWGNGRIGDNPVVLERWKKELADPRYIHGGPEAGIRKELGVGK